MQSSKKMWHKTRRDHAVEAHPEVVEMRDLANKNGNSLKYVPVFKGKA